MTCDICKKELDEHIAFDPESIYDQLCFDCWSKYTGETNDSKYNPDRKSDIKLTKKAWLNAN